MILLLLATTVVGTAWMVRRVYFMGTWSDSIMTARQKAAVIAIAEFPVTARTAIYNLTGNRLFAPLLLKKAEVERAWWIRKFPFPQDDGYLLFSGLYAQNTAASVRLIRISDGKTVASWLPDWVYVLSKISPNRYGSIGLSNISAVNPLLLDDGSIVFSTGNSSVRLPPCSRRPDWVLDETTHHSTALDSDGTSFWTPSIESRGFEGNAYLHTMARDDAIARISADGKMLYRLGFDKIFNSNDLEFLLFSGNNATDMNDDPIHLNQIKSAPHDTKYWKKGDLLISLRNPNTVLLFRPSENKVIWRQTGPWIHQHSADFINDHQISVFNNNSVLRNNNAFVDANFLAPASINEVMVYDFDTNQITQPFKSLLETARPRSVTQGRARILPDGGLFLEETDNGRILRFSKDKLLWSFVNDYDDKHIGVLAWSSYLTPEEARKPMEALKTRGCLSDAAPALPINGS